MFNKIMAPYDGTAFGRDGLLRALQIANRSNAALHIVQVEQTPTVVAADDSPASLAEAYGIEALSAAASLYATAAECRAHSSVEVSAALERGPVADALRGYAIRNHIDLVVMSSHRRGGLARAWLGSVADRLIRDTGLPVLVVRPPSVSTAAAGSSDYRRILVPLDGSALAEQSITPAVRLALTDGATITVLQVIPEEGDLDDDVLQSARGAAPASEVEQAERYLARVAGRPMHRAVQFETKVIIARNVPDAIIAYARAEEADLVAIATRGHGGVARLIYGSVADRVIKESVISTMVIHPVVRDKVPVENQERALWVAAT